MIFTDRREAGRRLGVELQAYAGRNDVLVFGLARGGVPVAFEVAHAIQAPLDVFVVRKLGAPGQQELALGAIASGGVRVLNEGWVNYLEIPASELEAITSREEAVLVQRERLYRGDRAFPNVEGKTVILVDDGLATGSTMKAAVQAMRLHRPASIVVAVPTGSREACEAVRAIADSVLCLDNPEPFHSVGSWYRNFGQTTDDEVRNLLGPLPVTK